MRGLRVEERDALAVRELGLELLIAALRVFEDGNVHPVRRANVIQHRLRDPRTRGMVELDLPHAVFLASSVGRLQAATNVVLHHRAVALLRVRCHCRVDSRGSCGGTWQLLWQLRRERSHAAGGEDEETWLVRGHGWLKAKVRRFFASGPSDGKIIKWMPQSGGGEPALWHMLHDDGDEDDGDNEDGMGFRRG